MNKRNVMSTTVLAAAIAALVGGSAGIANATEPCGDFGECKALIEINAEDGDIGFHFLMDGDDLIYGALFNPDHDKIFVYRPKRELRLQTSTELFQESAEHLCAKKLVEDEDDIVVTLKEFVDRFSSGYYHFFGINADGEGQHGQTWMDFSLPAMPDELDWSVEPDEYEDGEFEYEISWEAGEALGECANWGELNGLVNSGVLPAYPEDVKVVAWEVVLEVDIEFDEEDEPTEEEQAVANSEFVVRILGDAALEVTVPADFIDSLPPNTPAKIEVGAIGVDDNATFAEEGDICLNLDLEEDEAGCGFDEEEEEGEE